MTLPDQPSPDPNVRTPFARAPFARAPFVRRAISWLGHGLRAIGLVGLFVLAAWSAFLCVAGVQTVLGNDPGGWLIVVFALAVWVAGTIMAAAARRIGRLLIETGGPA